MKPSPRKTYQVPALKTYGAVSDITRQAGEPNVDVPSGSDGTAYSPA